MADDTKPQPPVRARYRHFHSITTRWMDNDQYGHINNVAYYSFFDTAVNAYLIEAGALDPATSEAIGLVVASECNYFAPLSFPQTIDVGVGTGRIGRTSVQYDVAIFGPGAEVAAACGSFTHVYVDRKTSRPQPLGADFLAALSKLS